MPFMWSTIATEGPDLRRPVAGSRAHVTNGLWFSYPGYNEMFSGARRSARRQQRQGAEPERHRARVAQRPAGLRGPRRGVRRVGRAAVDPQHRAQPSSRRHAASRRCRRRATDARARDQRARRPTCRVYWDYGAVDAPIVYAALERLRTRKPRVLYVMLGEGDEWAHAGPLRSLSGRARSRADRFIRRVWDTLQSLPDYKNQTTLLVTTDHGRGATTTDWTDHGRKVPAAETTWMAALGPGVRAARRAAIDDRHDVAARRDDCRGGRRGFPRAPLRTRRRRCRTSARGNLRQSSSLAHAGCPSKFEV